MKTVIKEYRDKSSSSSDEDEDDKSATVTSKSKQKKSKAVKKISAKTPLEAIQESDSPHDMQQMSKSNSFAKCFGVKSYLHEFYDESSSQSRQNSQIDNSATSSQKRLNIILRCTWKITFWLGVLLLISGILLLIAGYTFRQKAIIVASLNNLDMIDKGAIEFNNNIENCKIIGLIVFTFGGFIIAGSLVAPSFICYRQCLFKEDIFEYDDPRYTPPNETDQIKSPIQRINFEHVQPQSISETNIACYMNKVKNYDTMSSDASGKTCEAPDQPQDANTK